MLPPISILTSKLSDHSYNQLPNITSYEPSKPLLKSPHYTFPHENSHYNDLPVTPLYTVSDNAHTYYSRDIGSSSEEPESPGSYQVLLEKRKRNASASARFRDRRKQKEKTLHDTCAFLEKRARELEDALLSFDPHHPLLLDTSATLSNRVEQLEEKMYQLDKEKQYDSEKLTNLERENRYLRSVLTGKDIHFAPY